MLPDCTQSYTYVCILHIYCICPIRKSSSWVLGFSLHFCLSSHSHFDNNSVVINYRVTFFVSLPFICHVICDNDFSSGLFNAHKDTYRKRESKWDGNPHSNIALIWGFRRPFSAIVIRVFFISASALRHFRSFFTYFTVRRLDMCVCVCECKKWKLAPFVALPLLCVAFFHFFSFHFFAIHFSCRRHSRCRSALL